MTFITEFKKSTLKFIQKHKDHEYQRQYWANRATQEL
jgi:hypothetical protein